jgi:glycosyltransferase XagB
MIVELPPDEQGRDPLVTAYQRQHARRCSRVVLRPLWIPLAWFVCLITGAVCHRLMVELPAEPDPHLPLWLQTWLAQARPVFIGMALAGAFGVLLRGIRLEWFLGGAVAALCYLTAYDYLISASLITATICMAYLLVVLGRLLAVLRAGSIHVHRLPGEETDWPTYTVLVPVYREAAIIHQTVAALQALDYPYDKLDVKLLLEADDSETRQALAAMNLPAGWEVLITPPAPPTTKPRACNHGLHRARGEFLVIYDAEDRPEPDQLRKAVHAFRQESEQVVCLQARLAFRNPRQNLLTQLFSQEYNGWFGWYLAGLCRLRAPIPLGGTSNHFRSLPLRACGGWDPFNVTEDCDLGLRLALAGHRVGLLDSTTWEEANSQIGNWLRQRSRWLKGYLQTALVWYRQPLLLLRRLGLLGTAWFSIVVASTPVLLLLNPLLWLILAYYLMALGHDITLGYGLWECLSTRPWAIDRWSWPILYIGVGENAWWSLASITLSLASITLLLSNLLFAILHVLCGRHPQQHFDSIRTVLALPVYWLLMSLAAWKGAWQLIRRPHYWEKTVHGLDTEE